MIQPKELLDSEWAEWCRLTPARRWLECGQFWQTCLALGASLAPELETQSPFFDARKVGPVLARQRGIEERLKREWRNDLESLRFAE